MMTRVHLIGAAGYAAGELIRLLVHHPHVQLGVIESESGAGQLLGGHFPELRGLVGDRRFDFPGTVLAALERDDAVFCAGAHGMAKSIGPQLLEAGARVIDLSDDFRDDPPAHGAVYGFTERYAPQIERARLIANPGCYPTAALLALMPLREFAGGIAQIVIDAKSGITGAGRKPKSDSLFAEVDEDVRPYGLQGHRHAPEIGQELRALGIGAPFTFTPQVVPLARGMLVCAYVVMRPGSAPSEDAVLAAFRRAYAGRRFIRVLDPTDGLVPSLRAVARTNDAELHVSVLGDVVRMLCAIDNLGKGAAGQAVQNLNVMYGYPEELALDDRAVVR